MRRSTEIARESGWRTDSSLMKIEEIVRYSDFTRENTVFSTQHGVKGEQYENVLAVFDDIGADWSNSLHKDANPNLDGERGKGYSAIANDPARLRMLLTGDKGS